MAKHQPLKKHANCEVIVRPSTGLHAAYYWCVKHKKHVVWLSKREYELYQEIKK